MAETNERDQRLGIQFDPSQGGRYLPTGQGTPTPTVSGPPTVLGLSGISPQPQGQQMVPQSEGMLQQFNQMAQQPLVGNINQSLASGVSGMGTAFAGGQGNPVLSQMMAERDQRLKTKLEQINLQMRVEAGRTQQADKLGKIAMDLVKQGGAAATLGAPMLGDYLKKQGYQASPDLIKALGTASLGMDDVKDILQAKNVAGLDLQTVQAMKKNLPSDMVAEIYSKPMTDQVAKYLGQKTTSELQLDKLNLDEKTGKIAAADLKQSHPEMEVKPLLPYLQKTSWGEYKKFYPDLTDPERAKVLSAAMAKMEADNLKRLAAQGAIKTDEGIDKAPAGGTIHDRLTGVNIPMVNNSQYRQTMPDGSGRWVKVDAQDKRMVGLMTRGMGSVTWLKSHITEVLASVAGNQDMLKNITKAIENKATTFAGATPQVSAFLGHVLNAAFEEARAAGGGTTLRIQILKAIKADITPGLSDSRQQAIEKLDIMAVNMTNVIRNIYGDPEITFERKMGPGKYDAVDTTTGEEVPIILQPGQWSPPKYRVTGPR